MSHPNPRRHQVLALLLLWGALQVDTAWSQGTPQGPMTWNHTYDGNGNLSVIVGPLGAQTNVGHDRLDRLRSITQAAPLPGADRPVIGIDYNGQDRISEVRDPRGLTTAYRTNGLGNVGSVKSPDTGTSSFT